MLKQIQMTCPETIRDVTELFLRYTAKGEFLGSGRNRAVFALNNRWVVKLPKNDKGCMDNSWEDGVSRTRKPSENDVQHPRTRMVVVNGIPVLFMERVQCVEDSYDKLPDWVYSVDCGQVGYDWQGNLVAYDYGLN